MKKVLILIALICLSCSTDHAAKDSATAVDCDAEYMALVNELDNSSLILKADKEKYRPPLIHAYQLCESGRIAEAEKLVDELRQDGHFEEVFENLQGN